MQGEFCFKICTFKYMFNSLIYIIECDSKIWTQIRTSIFPEIYEGRSESKERLRIHPAQLLHCTG